MKIISRTPIDSDDSTLGRDDQATNAIFAVSRRVAGVVRWEKIIRTLDDSIKLSDLPNAIIAVADKFSLPPFLPQLIFIEWQKCQVAMNRKPIAHTADKLELNPTLRIIELDWKLSGLFEDSAKIKRIEQGQEIVAIWRDPISKNVRLNAISKEDFLLLKFIEEEHNIPVVADLDVSGEMIDQALRQAVKQGILIPNRLMLWRDINILDHNNPKDPDLIYSDSFTLQWHVTNLCDFNCKHCYDRSERPTLTFVQAEPILDDLKGFCHERYIKGHVCFTGGNPLLYPQFFELYAATAKRGFSASILGNPTPKENLQKIVNIQKPTFFQVSLEGLEDQNDFIRGKGTFKKMFAFLDLLREMQIRTVVMLTLTKDNIDQVLPLADLLCGHADNFTFNRLASVGEGANLSLPSERAYSEFLETYVKASKENPILGYKDNLINIILDKRGQKLSRGCTGYGCGAAFNFIVVLPDGEAYACRKFPSPIGNLTTQSLSQVYDSPAAASYRRGSVACDGCRLRLKCGGCLAVLYGLGKNIFKDRDPYCFIER